MSLFPPTDAGMKVRLKRQAMALLSYMMFLLPMLYAVRNDWMLFSTAGVFVFVGLAVLVNGVFFTLIRSGVSKRFPDPSMTFAQILVSLIMALALVRYAEEARPVFITLFFASFFFGVFGLTRKQFWRLAFIAIAGYAVVIGSEMIWMNHDPETMRLDVLEFLVLSMMMCWMAWIGGYVAHLRQNVASQKIELVSTMTRLRLLVSHDELTGVFNRRHLMQLLEHERARHDRHSNPFSVCLLDIDHFKIINDTYGHATGDEVLREFSARMRQNARKMDWLGRNPPRADTVESRDATNGADEVSVGRYGGEEFMIVMPHTPQEAALAGAERLRAAISAVPFHTASGPLDVKFSAGVAQFIPGESVESTIARADKALYRAKALGRNQTQMAAPPGILPKNA